MSFIQLTIASIKMFFRDTRALFFNLFLPILFMVIFGIADFDKFANSKIGIIDGANNDQSKALIESMGKIDIVDIVTGDTDELKNQLKDGKLNLVLELPQELVKSKMVDIDIPGLQLAPNIKKPKFPNLNQ